MSTGTATVVGTASERASLVERLRSYFWSDRARAVQTVLGLIWLLDGGLQFQSFMYSHGFPQMLIGMTQGQPAWITSSMIWAAKIANGNLDLWNSLFAITQVGIGLGILYRPTTKLALAASFGWALVVWWFGEAFGMMLMNMAMPLTGAPGAVLLYGFIGAIAWPGGRPGGLLGERGAKTFWVVLWLVMAWLWLLAPSASANATSSAANAVPAGIGPLNSLQNDIASWTRGDGLVIALIFCALSAAIAIAPALRWHAREWITLSIVINLVFWVIFQGFGGILDGGATDPNAGPLFVLLAFAVMPLFAGERSPEA